VSEHSAEGSPEGFEETARDSTDWAGLRASAAAAARSAYAPYSRLHVGAAALTDSGRLVTGCNVENASYGLTLCAECGLVSALHAGGDGRLVALSVVAGDGEPLAPCGRCRQLLMEHGGPSLLVDAGPDAPPRRLGELLPDSFGAPDIAARREGEGAVRREEG
jgi:cytidine deaminase